MAGHSGSQFNVRATGNACPLANVMLAVMGRPVFDDFDVAAHSAKLVLAAPNANTPSNADSGTPLSDSSAGPRATLRFEKISALILRI
jgi:hypothetical protein